MPVTGARAAVTLGGRAAPWSEPIVGRAGETVLVGPAEWGLRSYVAFAGGVDVPLVLGSRSTDTLAGVGPPTLARGMQLAIGGPTGEPRPMDVSVVRRPTSPATLHIRLGPRLDWFSPVALQMLAASTYTVSADSNRIGLRLRGPALPRERSDELPSEGLVLGAVQVPASGQPLVFLNDHPTTGGYPVIGVVRPEDLPSCAQLRPGDRLRFSAR